MIVSSKSSSGSENNKKKKKKMNSGVSNTKIVRSVVTDKAALSADCFPVEKENNLT